MIKCIECLLCKPMEEFAWRSKAKGTKHKKCKDCQKSYFSSHYEKNKDYYKEKVNSNRPALKDKNRKFIREYLKNNPCVDCGISDVRVLQFDHKELKINDPNRRGFGELMTSRPKLIAEIAKCDVRCANCHMIRTAEQMGWSRI